MTTAFHFLFLLNKHVHTCSTVTSSFLYLSPAVSLRVGLHLSVISSVSPCLRFPRGCRQISVREWLASSTSAESERWENMVNCEGRNRPLLQRSCPTVYPSVPAVSVSAPRWLPGYRLYKHKPGQASEVICVIVGCSSLFGVNLHAHTHSAKAKVSRFVFIHNNLS